MRAVRVMQGRSDYAKFVGRPEFEGVAAADLRASLAAPGLARPLAAALGQALDQVDKISRREAGAPAAGRTAKLLSA